MLTMPLSRKRGLSVRYRQAVSVTVFIACLSTISLARLQTRYLAVDEKPGTVLCHCTSPFDKNFGRNGYTCSDSSFDGYCSSDETCNAEIQDLWEHGEFPCEKTTASVVCECDSPGIVKSNAYTCNDPAFNGKCRFWRACLSPVGHVFSPTKPPCGWKSVSTAMEKYGALSSIDKRSACSRTILDLNKKDAHLCDMYEKMELIVPNCSAKKTIVPRIIHSVGHLSQRYIESSVAAANPTFRRNRHDDRSAAEYILKFCGDDAARAYTCLRPPSYRADLFRFCALFGEGGVYLDEDIVPLHPLESIISECSTATIGHDFPADGRLAKQMKILAAAPGASIMKCAVDSIVYNVRNRAYPGSPLELTGPLMLQRCYEKFPQQVAITYIDTRGAIWPYTGMRAGNAILAYEYPDSPKHFCLGKCRGGRKHDYATMYKRREVYSDLCELKIEW